MSKGNRKGAVAATFADMVVQELDDVEKLVL